jgi:uncharacterized RDD family membrane protein YckC
MAGLGMELYFIEAAPASAMIESLMPCKNHPQVLEPLLYCSRCGEAFCPNCVVQIGTRLYCAVCKQESLGNLRSGLPVTGLVLASIGRRFGALFLDGLIINLPLMFLFGAAMIMFGAFRSGGPSDAGAAIIVGLELFLTVALLGIWVLYEGLMLRRDGQTLGKKAMRVKVVSAEGGPLSGGQAFGRAAMRQLLGFVPCLGLVNYLTAFGVERTCIHDMAARTRVVNWDL